MRVSVLVEANTTLPGREVNIAVIEVPELRALRPTEIRLPEEKPGTWSILTYEGKWSPDSLAYEPVGASFSDARK